MPSRANYSNAIKWLKSISLDDMRIIKNPTTGIKYYFSVRSTSLDIDAFVVQDTIDYIVFNTHNPKRNNVKGSNCEIRFERTICLNSTIEVVFGYNGYYRSSRSSTYIDFKFNLSEVNCEEDWLKLPYTHDVTWDDYCIIRSKYNEIVKHLKEISNENRF